MIHAHQVMELPACMCIIADALPQINPQCARNLAAYLMSGKDQVQKKVAFNFVHVEYFVRYCAETSGCATSITTSTFKVPFANFSRASSRLPTAGYLHDASALLGQVDQGKIRKEKRKEKEKRKRLEFHDQLRIDITVFCSRQTRLPSRSPFRSFRRDTGPGGQNQERQPA
jgi:hypothetical protein